VVVFNRSLVVNLDRPYCDLYTTCHCSYYDWQW